MTYDKKLVSNSKKSIEWGVGGAESEGKAVFREEIQK
jgi:hypothetical protein